MTKRNVKKDMCLREDESKYFVRGESFYKKLNKKFIKEHRGMILAIDPDSGSYVVGDDELDAAQKAQIKFPKKPLDYFRVGEKVVHKFRLESKC